MSSARTDGALSRATTRRGRTLRKQRYSALEASLLNEEEKAVFHALDATLTPGTNIENEPSKFAKCCKAFFCDKGVISILLMFTILVAGIIILGVSYASSLQLTDDQQMIMRTVSVFLISAGVFGVAGGGANYLALLMLFYEVPLLVGTGVIPRQHEQILELLRTIVLQLLFDSRHLENYVQERINKFSVEVNIVDCITRALNSKSSERIIDNQLNRLYSQPEAAYLNAVGVPKGKLKVMIKPAVLSLCAESAPLVLGTAVDRNVSESGISVPQIRRAMNQFLQQRGMRLTKQRIRSFMQGLVFRELGSLVVLGSISGLIIGLVAQALRISFVQLNIAL